MTDYCPHDEDPAICPPCRRAAGKDKINDGLAWSHPFAARYDGFCDGGCNLPISVGQQVVLAEDLTFRKIVRHAWCAS